MIWWSWRQFRVQALAGAVAAALAAAYLVHLGLDIRAAHDAYQARCRVIGDCAGAMAQFRGDYETTLLFLAGGVALVPVLIGGFWGAPLVARELETGTHRLVWNQSVTRPRWLAVRLAVAALAAVAAAGLVSALLTWAAAPVDRVAGDRFSTIFLGARDIAPVAYACFAVTLGTVTGLLLRRTVPAMALTMLAVLVTLFVVPNFVRPHFMVPERVSMPMTADAINQARGLGSITGGAVVRGVGVPGAWVTEVSELRTADGRPLAGKAFDTCFDHPPKTGAGGTFGDTAACLGGLGLHVDVAYQPDDRYWPFQLIETAFYLGLSGLLTAFGLWRIRSRS
jgi:hypothetical protein